MGNCQTANVHGADGDGPPYGDHSPYEEDFDGDGPPYRNPRKSQLVLTKEAPQDQAAPKAKTSAAANQEKSPVDFILNLTDDKPLDARDVVTFSDAKNEIQLIRKFAAEYLATFANDDNAEKDMDDHADKGVRGALYDKQDFSNFEKVSYEKKDAIRTLIYDAIKPNVLFEHDTEDEILQIIDVFKPRQYSKGETIITQGDEGSEFYVVESGELSISVIVKGDESGGDENQVKVGNYSTGSAFGELALIFGSPRAATIEATSDCKLWSIERTVYRSVMSQLRYEQYLEKKDFLQTCVVNEKTFGEIFDASQMEDLTIATKIDHYKQGEVILREGEMGDTFYIVKSGDVVYYKKSEEEMQKIEVKKAFGTTSLLKGVVSSYTYKANSPVDVFYLTRKDFESLMGPFQNILDGKTVARSFIKSESKRTVKTSMTTEGRYELELDELETFNVLGRGAFGEVSLVQAKKTKKVFALKAQSKHYIAKKGQKEHVLNEYRIMKEIENPSILGIHCAMQDEKYLYFLVDLLPGGELMKYLVTRARKGHGFTEDITRFYAASVVLAYEQLHSLMIAYRDLKPENIVLTKDGYGVLVDFGLAKEIEEGQTYSFCGTPDYLAPEIIRGTGHDWAVDYWGLGVFLYEMTNGTAPFYATNQAHRTRKILKGIEYVEMPSNFSGGLTDLISNLLIDDQSKRLGRTKNGVQGIKNHRWFAGFDWEGFVNRTLEAPIQPTIPENIKTMGKPKVDNPTLFQEANYAPKSDWCPDLKNLKEW